MKKIKLTPIARTHKVNFPMRFDVDAARVDIPDSTGVIATLEFRLAPAASGGALFPTNDLPGGQGNFRNFIQGTWASVSERIERITPTRAGYYTIKILAVLNVAPDGYPLPVPAQTIYRSLEIKVT